MRRIIQLFDRMTTKYRHRIDLFKQYLVFCYKIHSKKQIAKVLSQALATHPNSLLFWLLGVYHEFEVERNPFKARKIFFKALKINGANLDFWREYFGFEARFFKLVSERAKLIKKGIEVEESKKESDKNDDFIGFDGFGRNFAKGSEEGKLENQPETIQESEVLKTVYDTMKEKFPLKSLLLPCYKTLKELDLLDDLSTQLGIEADMASERAKDGEFAYGLFTEKGGSCLEDYIDALTEFKQVVVFIKTLLKKEEGNVTELWHVLKEKDLIKRIQKEDREGLNSILLGFIEYFKKNPIKENRNELMRGIRDLSKPLVEKDGEMLCIFIESQLLMEVEKVGKDEYELILESFKTGKSQFKPERKLKILNYLLEFSKKLSGKVKIHKVNELLSIGLENLLLHPEELNVFLNNFLNDAPKENLEDYYNSLFKYKSVLPLDIWLKYLEISKNYNQKKQIIQQLKVWFQKNLIKILQFELKFEEEAGNYIELQKITFEISKNS